MKVITISNMYPSESDPVYGTFVKNFVDELKSRNPGAVNDIAVIAGKRKGKLAKAKAYVSFYSSVIWKLLRRRYDVVYVHTITFPIIPLRVAMLFRRLNVVFNVHGDDVLPNTRMKERLKHIARPVLPKATMIVVPSDYFKEVVLNEFEGVEADKIFVSPSGGLHSRFYVESSCDSVGNTIKLGFVSRIDQGKGWDLFLKAVAGLNAARIDCRGVMAGRGAQSGQLLELIEELGLREKVDYLGAVAQDKLPGVYGSVDLFIFPSVREAESLGLVGLEAMAAHTPVVASAMAGPAGYVRDGVNGYLFIPGDLDSLMERIRSFLALTPEKRRDMADAAYGTALRYRAEDVADALYRNIEKVAHR